MRAMRASAGSGGGLVDRQLDGPAEDVGILGEQHDLAAGGAGPDDLEELGRARWVDADEGLVEHEEVVAGLVEEELRGPRRGPRPSGPRCRRRRAGAAAMASSICTAAVATAASARSISGRRTSACPWRRVGQLQQGAEGVALGALVDRQLLGELAGAAGEVADLGGGLLEAGLGRRHGLAGRLDGRRASSSACCSVPDDGLDLGTQLLGGREPLEALRVLAGPDGELALEGTDRALGDLQGLGGPVGLGLGRPQLELEGRPAGLDGGELGALLVRRGRRLVVVGVLLEGRGGGGPRGSGWRPRPGTSRQGGRRPRRGRRPAVPGGPGRPAGGAEERDDVVAGVDAQELGDLLEQPRPLGAEVVELGGVSTESRGRRGRPWRRSARGPRRPGLGWRRRLGRR